MSRLFSLVVCLILLQAFPCFAQRINSIPASDYNGRFVYQTQQSTEVDVSGLRRSKPKAYLLDAGDTLAVFIEGVLGNFDETPPVQFPAADSDLLPSTGYPVPVREDGTVSLPLVKPVPVKGLTIQQAEDLITRKYRDGETPILKDDSRILVSLMKERTYRVTVIRQDFGNGRNRNSSFNSVNQRSDFSSRGIVLQMPAYKNDVLSALVASGGLPGLNEKSSIRVQRANAPTVQSYSPNTQYGRQEFPRSDMRSTGFTRSNYRAASPVVQSFRPSYSNPYSTTASALITQSNTITIPTRVAPGQRATIRPEDVILNDGDIVYVDSRDAEVYYTAGLLGGGQFLLPRDTDLDVLQAVSLSGNQIGATAGSIGRGGRLPPTELIVLRRRPNGGQIAIRVDLNRALTNPRERLKVVAGDILLLRYKTQEQIGNFGLGVLEAYGARQLFGN